MTQIPEIYRAGYEKAARLTPALSARYIRHTTAADPPADGVMQALAGHEPRQIHRCINARMEQDAPVLRQAERFGAAGNPEERRAFMQIRRYASLLIGTPDDLLFDGDEAQTRELCRIARICEPPPSPESVAIANALVNARPDIAGMPPRQRAALSNTPTPKPAAPP